MTILLATLCLGACSSSSLPERTPIYFVAEAMFDLDEYVTQFEAAHPDVQVHVSYQMPIPDDWPEHFDAALMTRISAHREANLLLDLLPLVEADSQFYVDDYYPGALATGYVDGRLVAIPIGLEFDVLIYDPRQLVEAGAPLPADGWTWEDLMNTARAVGRYQASVGDGIVFVEDAEYSSLLLNWIQEQVSFYKEDIDGTFVPELDRPEMQSAVSNACDAMTELAVGVDSQSHSYLDYRPLVYLQDGKAAMLRYSLAGFRRQHSQYPNLAVAAFPQPNFSRDLTMFGALTISRGTAHQQAVWQWVRFLSQQNVFSRIIGGDDLPARRSVAKDLQAWEALDVETEQVIRAILDGQTDSETKQNQDPLRIVLDNLLNALFETCFLGTAPGTTLAEAQQVAMDKVSTWYAERDDPLEAFNIVPPPIPDGLSQVLKSLMLHSNEQTYLAAAQEFETSHPGWSIQQIVTGGLDGQVADCVSGQTSNYGAVMFLNLQQVLFPIASIGELDPSLRDESFFPQAIEAVSWHGQLIGVPTGIQPLVLYYNSEVFAQLGLAAPTSDWTIADVLDAAEEIAAANPMWLGYAPRTGTEVRFILEQQGIRLFDDKAYPRFTEPDVLQAIERLRALHGGRQVLSGEPTVMELSLSTGKLFGPLDLDAVALQPYPGSRWPVQVYVSGVLRQSTHVHKAWEWVTFLSKQQGLHGTNALPAAREAAESQVTCQMLGADLHAAYLTALERDTALLERETTIIEDAALWWFEKTLLDANAGDVESEFQQAQIDAEQFVDCVVTAGKADDVQTLAMCAEQVDPDHWLVRITASVSSSE